MLAQYLVSLGAISSLKSNRKSVKAVTSLQIKKERTFHVHLLVECFCVAFQKYILRQGFKFSFALPLLLIFHQISGSCFYKIVLIK